MSALEQNIPKGFQHTELGILPQEWQVLTIDEALSFKMILDQMDGNHGELYPKSHEFKDDGIPYVGATDFYSGKIDYKHCKRLPLKRAKLFKKGVAKNGDVLFAHNATVGPSSLVETHEDFIIISTTATYYRCNGEEIKNTYLLNFFRSKLFESQYSSVMSQSTRNQVPILAQRKFYLALPHIKEQTAIANALSDVDALLAELEKLIAKKQAIKTATMQQLLTGKTRLPQFATYAEGEKKGQPKGTKSSELGDIPEDWEIVKFGSIVNYIKGYPFKSAEYTDSGIRVVRVSDTSFTSIRNEKPIFVSENSRRKYKKWSLEKGNIIFTTVGSKPPMYDSLVGKAILVESNHEGFLLNQNAVLIKPKLAAENISNLLVSHFRTERYIDHIEQIYRGNANQASITLDGLFEFEIPLPTQPKEQTAIATILSDMDNEIQTLEQRLAKTRQIKQGMMQELLTGRTRLPFKKES
ncbi:restriction endonuclease subunit S [Vibrio chagasii]|uniref:restriction endonuclease subunit S n=1 Tax=Vibrio chagasii TaxID=170679 RepID=UPI0038CE5E62